MLCFDESCCMTGVLIFMFSRSWSHINEKILAGVTYSVLLPRRRNSGRIDHDNRWSPMKE
jgi:hypothetical protein